ncbi:MAG TPA: hypothetical protein VGH76_24105 [Actinomycetospora sp.]|jgi:hypothetical protein|uniref:hypothetical protein n=1 Tax=Actinomycetospora sp. TaxID=1872135 RepID=UPI002F406537
MADLGRPSLHPTVGQRAGGLVRGVLGVLGVLARLVIGLIVAVLVVHIVLVVLGANPANAVARAIAGLADSLTLGLGDLFVLANPTVQVVVSYGLPALVWLIAGGVVVGLLRLLTRPRSGLA